MNVLAKHRKPKSAARPVTQTEILARIEQQKAELKRLNNELYRLAEASVSDEAVEREYHKCAADMVATQQNIERLQQALVAVDHRIAVTAATERAAMRRGQLAEFEAVLSERLAAVTKMAAGIKAASEANAAFVAATEKMRAATPDGCSLPTGLEHFEYSSEGRAFPAGIATAIASEMFRAAEAPQYRLPGAKAPTLQAEREPQKVESMTLALERMNGVILGDVRGQVERAEAAETNALAS